MYNAGPEAAMVWRALFSRVFDDLALDIEMIEHKWPQSIDSLWREPALCCAFMCGWPYARSDGMQALAAPVPLPERYEGLPRYCSEFLAREESDFERLEDAFGHRFGWMAPDSQSGFNAPRTHLARYATPERPALFSQSIGPLGNPAKALEALVDGNVDVVALDSFYLDLVRHHHPERLAGLRTIAQTEWTAIPLLVAAPTIPASVVERLRSHLLRLHEDASMRTLLEAALLERFTAPVDEAYQALERTARETITSGYAEIR
jgi:ABC-type phosphate/phosphonate transport system substrate-binding protein